MGKQTTVRWQAAQQWSEECTILLPQYEKPFGQSVRSRTHQGDVLSPYTHKRCMWPGAEPPLPLLPLAHQPTRTSPPPPSPCPFSSPWLLLPLHSPPTHTCRSRSLVGSSRMSKLGRSTSTDARCSRRRSPPLREETYWYCLARGKPSYRGEGGGKGLVQASPLPPAEGGDVLVLPSPREAQLQGGRESWSGWVQTYSGIEQRGAGVNPPWLLTWVDRTFSGLQPHTIHRVAQIHTCGMPHASPSPAAPLECQLAPAPHLSPCGRRQSPCLGQQRGVLEFASRDKPSPLSGWRDRGVPSWWVEPYASMAFRHRSAPTCPKQASPPSPPPPHPSPPPCGKARQGSQPTGCS